MRNHSPFPVGRPRSSRAGNSPWKSPFSRQAEGTNLKGCPRLCQRPRKQEASSKWHIRRLLGDKNVSRLLGHSWDLHTSLELQGAPDRAVLNRKESFALALRGYKILYLEPIQPADTLFRQPVKIRVSKDVFAVYLCLCDYNQQNYTNELRKQCWDLWTHTSVKIAVSPASSMTSVCQ